MNLVLARYEPPLFAVGMFDLNLLYSPQLSSGSALGAHRWALGMCPSLGDVVGS